MPKANSKNKKKPSSVNAAAASFGIKDPSNAVTSLLNLIRDDRSALKTLKGLLAEDDEDDDDDAEDDDDDNDNDTAAINATVNEINDAQSQLTDLELRLAQHAAFIPRLAAHPDLIDSATREQANFLALKRSLLALISSGESKLVELRAALASRKAPVKGKKKTFYPKSPLEEGE